MRYDDASNTGSMAADSAPTARPDVDSLPSNSFGPASGNAITGAGTVSGAAGADTAGDGPARVVEVNGSGGPTATSGDSFQAAGQYGVLSMDAQGNFNYVRNAGTPDGVQDVFGYTIADADGSTSATTLTMNIGEAITLQSQNVVNLPAGVQMSDIKVVGRDLVITMPDGSQMVIPNGAVFVPQLVIGDVELPATNLASLLIDSEPQPAAGQLQSSGGNFENPVPPLDPGVPLGDLIPPTELAFPPIEIEEPTQFIDRDPELIIEPVDGAPAVNAISDVDEAGLPVRAGPEPEGTGEEAAAGDNGDPSETTTGVINITSPDGIGSVTINGELVTGVVGQTFVGTYGTLTITGFLPDGDIQYSYTLANNTIGDATHDDFEVIVTDSDGDTATGSLTINIIDDEPIARNDTDAVPDGADGTDGNVLSGADTTSGAAGRDSPGADGFNGETNDDIDGVTAVQAGTSTTFDSSDAVAQDGTGKVVVGTFGTLTIHNDGSYTYVLLEGTPGGGTDVFTYQITDGDGDTDTATLTINVPDQNSPPRAEGDEIAVSEEGLAGANQDDTGNPDTTNLAVAPGSIGASDPDGDPLDFTLGVPNPNPNFTSQGETVLWSVSPDGNMLTGFVDGGEGPDRIVITVAITDGGPGNYTVTLYDQIDHPDATTEDEVQFSVPVTVSDGVESTATTIVVHIEDDSPRLVNEGSAFGAVGEDALIPDGNPDAGDTKTTTASGSLAGIVSFGADEPGSFTFDPNAVSKMLALNLTSDSAPLKYAIVGDTLIAYTGATSADGQVFTLQVQADGDYQFTLLDQIDHLPNSPADNDDQVLTIDFGDIVDARDFDGDKVDLDGRFNVSIEDDIPEFVSQRSITGAVGEDALVPDGNADFGDTKTTTASGSLAAIVSMGADQEGQFAFGSDAIAKMLALNLSSDSAPLKYAILGDTLVAYTGATNADGRVFTLQVQADGDYQFTLLDQIDHLPNSPADDDNQILTIDFGDIIDAVDEDGDTLDLDGRFTIDIEDDIPEIPNEGSVNGAVGEDALPGANPDAGDTKTTIASGSLASVTDFGADQPGTFSFDPNAVTKMLALNLTSNSVALKYAIVGDTLIAYTGATSADGRVFTLELQSDGDYRFTLLDQIDHLPNSPANDDNQNLIIDFGDIVDATDADGDKIDFDGRFHIAIEDDIPIARNDTDDILGGGSTATGNVLTGADTTSGGAGADSAGADAPITVVKIQGAGGSDELFEGGVLSIGGAHGTLVMDANGQYTYTRTDGLGGVQDVFTYTIRDADGDITTATLTINIEDKVPEANTPPAVQLDDDVLGGNPGGTGDDPNSVNASGTLSGSGGDGDLDFFFDVAATGAALPAGFTLSGASTSSQIIILQGGTPVLTITLNTETGAYQVVQNNPIDHDTLNGLLGDDTENNVAFDIKFYAEDEDHDKSALANLHIDVDDDTPVLNEGNVSGAVGEDALVPDGNPDGGDTKTTVASGSLSSAVSFGADVPGTFSFEGTAVAEMLALNLTSNHVALKYAIVGDTLVAYTGATSADGRVFTLEVQSDGDYRFTLLDQIDHEGGLVSGSGDDQNLTINFGNIIDATDADGDKVDLDGKFSIAIEDDIPVLNEGTVSGAVGEDTLPGGNPDAGDTKTTIASGSIAGAVDFGADQPGAFSFEATAITEMTALGLTSNNVALKYAIVGDTLIAYTGATSADGRVFTLELQSDGDYRFTLLDQIDHLPNSPANDDNQNLTINFGNIIDATDADGDKVDLDGKFTISIEDDIPAQATPAVVANLDEDELAGGITDSDGETTVATGSLSTLASVGADQPGSFSFDLSGVTLQALTSHGAAVSYAVVGGMLVAYTGADAANPANYVFTVSLTSGGSFTVTLLKPIDHLPNSPANNDDQDITIDLSGAVKITDADNDSIRLDAGSFTVKLEDDIPTASATLNADADVIVDESGPGAAATIGLGANTAGNDEDVTGTGPIAVGNSGTAVINASVLFGADGAKAGSPSYAVNVTNSASGLTTTEGEAITLVQLNATTILGVVAAGGEHAGQVAFALAINAGTGVVTVEQYLSLNHPDETNPDDAIFLPAGRVSATVTATDFDNDTATSAPVDISGQIRFDDDAGDLGAFDPVTVQNEANAIGTGTFDYDPGADGHGSFAITGPTLTGVSYNVVQNANGALLTATSDPDGVGGNPPITLFTLQVNENGTYEFKLVTPDAGSSETFSLLNLSPGGPTPFVETPDGRIEFTGSGNGINSSTQGFGIDNQFVRFDESFTMEFHHTGAAGNQAPTTDPEYVSSATLVNDNINGALTIKVTFFNDDTGDTEVKFYNVTGTQTVLDPDTLAEFNRVSVEGAGGSGQGVRFVSLILTKTILPQDIDLDFNIQAFDEDGDPTTTSTLTVSVDAAEDSSLTTLSTLSSDTSHDTSSLFASNDNSQQHKLASSSNTTIMAGALAAAGLSTEPLAAEPREHGGKLDSHEDHGSKLDQQSLVVGDNSLEAAKADALGNVTDENAGKDAKDSGPSHDEATAGDKSVSSDAAPAHEVSELSQGTDAPAQSGPQTSSPVVAPTVAMPSAEQLAAATGKLVADGKGEGVASDAKGDVGQVLADALHGGGGKDLDALINAVAGHDKGGQNAHDALASHGPGDVSNGDIAVLAGFHAMQGPDMMTQMTMHQDAAPAHA